MTVKLLRRRAVCKEQQRLQGKLGNEKFVAKAPAEVVEKEKAKLQEAEQATAKLKEQYERIQAL